MGLTMHTFLLLIMLILSTGIALADPIGTYGVSGANPGNGQKYFGRVVVKHTGSTYSVVWNVQNQTYTGTGIGTDEHFTVVYPSGGDIGVATYSRRPDGSWIGDWIVSGYSQLGTEEWQPTKLYAVSGINPDGTKYSGNAAVLKSGDSYRVYRNIGSKESAGLAMGSDTYLDVGCKSPDHISISHFVRQPDGSWKGNWTNNNETKTGTELWTPSDKN
jgi:hypothetical protein